MNRFSNHSARQSHELEALQTRFALRVAARLTERADASSHDIGERLRFARESALERARLARAASLEMQPAAAAGAARIDVTAGAAAMLGRLTGGEPGGRSQWWLRLASVLPLLALLAGLVLIQQSNRDDQIRLAADIDAQLLVDDLPPDAYSDPGFNEYLKKTPRDRD